MNTLWEFVGGFFSLWNKRIVSEDQIAFGSISYPVSLGNKEIARRLMFDYHPALRYVFRPQAADFSVSGRPDMEKKSLDNEPLAEFNPFKMVEVLSRMKLVGYQDDKMVLTADDSRLPEFYASLYREILPENAAAIAMTLSLEDLHEAYPFLRDEEGYLKFSSSFKAIKKGIGAPASQQDILSFLDDQGLSRYREYGAFGSSWQKEVGQALGVPDASTAIAQKVSEELVRYNFWAHGPQEEFLKRAPMRTDAYWERSRNQHVYGVLEALTYFGATWVRNGEGGDANLLGFVFSKQLPLVPIEGKKGPWKEWHESGVFDRYLDLTAPAFIFPQVNTVIKEFVAELYQRL